MIIHHTANGIMFEDMTKYLLLHMVIYLSEFLAHSAPFGTSTAFPNFAGACFKIVYVNLWSIVSSL